MLPLGLHRLTLPNLNKCIVNRCYYNSELQQSDVRRMLQELLTISKRAAFLSTPSLYFSLPKVQISSTVGDL